MKNSKIRSMALVAMLGAVAFALMQFKFTVPVLSPVFKFEPSALAEVIGGFILGPIGAIEIIAIRTVLDIAFFGSSTMFTGELQNFLLSVAYVVPAVLIYRRIHTKKGAVTGLVAGTLCCVLVSILTNLYIVFPFYLTAFGIEMSGLVDMFAKVNPWVKDLPTLVAFSIVPFNLLSKGITSLITMLVYKKLSVPLKKFLQ